MTAAPVFNDDAVLFVEPKKGGIRKRFNRHLSRSYMLHLGDDDLHLSTHLFNATPRIIGQEPPQVKT